jgi:hypothetical protein
LQVRQEVVRAVHRASLPRAGRRGQPAGARGKVGAPPEPRRHEEEPMRQSFASTMLILTLAAGCRDRAPPEEPVAGPRERPLAQDGTIARGLTSTPDRVKVELDLATVRGALRIYRDEHNAWPASLEALGVTGLNYPADLDYDAARGAVTSRTYPTY